jgi:hypothetical protein
MPAELTSSIGRFGLIAAGGYAFGPIGAAVGALLGGFLFGSSGPKIEGPRLGDLDVSSSTYGGVIPLGFGVQKVAGAMIWATDIDEDKNTRKEGGSLFGGGQKIVEYRYFANFAVAFGEGPAGGLLRIWAGDRLIADLRAGAGAYANHPKYRFRIYLGTEDQEPDRLIRQHVENSDDFDGEDATPAFRGLVYIVFEDLPLDEFGNRIPGVTAEIAWAGAPQAVVKDTTFLPGAGYFTGSAVLDSERGFLYPCRQQPRLRRLGAERALHDRSTDQRPIWWRIHQAPVPLGQLERRRSHPVPYIRHHAEPASPGQWWRHCHHHVVRCDRERYELVDDRRDMATRTPRAVRGRLVACLEHSGGDQHQRPVRHLPLGRWGFSTSQDFNGDIALIACFASSWTPAMVRRWHADPFGFLRPWNEVPALMGSAPPATPPSTGTGVVTFLMG